MICVEYENDEEKGNGNCGKVKDDDGVDDESDREVYILFVFSCFFVRFVSFVVQSCFSLVVKFVVQVGDAV